MPAEDRAARRVISSGRVQGVAFRWSARREAIELGVSGWVRNLRDGRVEAHIEGERDVVARMQAWLESGPPSARVEGVESSQAEATGATDFEIRPDSG